MDPDETGTCPNNKKKKVREKVMYAQINGMRKDLFSIKYIRFCR